MAENALGMTFSNDSLDVTLETSGSNPQGPFSVPQNMFHLQIMSLWETSWSQWSHSLIRGSFFVFIFLLKDNCFTELCCLSNLNMNQP